MSEGSSKNIVCIDVQKGHYNSSTSMTMDRILKYLYEQGVNGSNITYVFNGPELGFEDKQELKDWVILKMYELQTGNDYPEEEEEFLEIESIVRRFDFVEKEYAFLRNFMDSEDMRSDPSFIVKIVET